MNYALLLLIFGIMPLVCLWLIGWRRIRRYVGSLLVIVVLIVLVSIPWDALAIERIWYYSPHVTSGLRLLNLPIEELAFFVIDGLLVGTLALLLGEKFHGHS